ncbi:MAG: hypothetical protein WCP28_21355 [Actinomycetes bacterium]
MTQNPKDLTHGDIVRLIGELDAELAWRGVGAAPGLCPRLLTAAQ